MEKKNHALLIAFIAITTVISVFMGGATFGYFYFRAEQRAINFARDDAISDIQNTLHALDERTKACLK